MTLADRATESGSLHHARAQRLLPGVLATFMSAFVAGVVTALNTGIDGGLPLRWLTAWLIAWPAAVAAAYLFRPLAWRLSLRIAGSAPAREAGESK